jgi:hypothetical protein
MYKEILQSITGIEMFPVISLVLFVLVFTAVLISVACMDQNRANRLAALPFDDSANRPHPENPR